MKINKRKLDYYNYTNNWPCANENYNKAHGLPTMQEWGFLNRVRNATYGMMREHVTQRDIKRFLETYTK